MALHALLYCERLYYLEEVESIYVANDRVYAGRTLHEEQRPSSDIVERIESFEVTESRLGLTGKVDRLMKRDGQWIPYEHKTGRCRMGDAGPEAWESDRVQIAAYALLLEEVTGRTIEEGRVRYHGDNQLVKVPIDDNLRKQALNAIDRAHELSIQPNRPPIVSNEHLCKHCSLAPVCLPEENRAVSEGSYKAVRLFPEKRERATVHITGYRTRIKKSADTIIVEKFNAENESVVEKIPAHNVESLNLHGNCQVSAQMIRYLARQEINLHWFTGGGEYVGGLQPGGPAVQRRLRQYEALRDPQFRMNLARRLIQAKCESQLKYILRSTRKNQKLRGDIDRSIEIMRTLLKKIEAAESSGTLLGIEGSFAR
ncbi:MAG: CRISPR-associated endonuclease Cas1, partial [Leptospiraceae bacterium]|nr:CRISPR-associated endonuclease Cas1 [Leptospiraceae bacterium]